MSELCYCTDLQKVTHIKNLLVLLAEKYLNILTFIVRLNLSITQDFSSISVERAQLVVLHLCYKTRGLCLPTS